MMKPNEILETCLYVDDLVAAENFYADILGLTFVSRVPSRHVFFRCGNRMLLLFNPEESDDLEGDLPPHGARGVGHLAFGVPEDSIDHWREQLEKAGVQIEVIFEWPRGGRSIYFRDPAGNSLELVSPRIWGLEEGPSLGISQD